MNRIHSFVLAVSVPLAGVYSGTTQGAEVAGIFGKGRTHFVVTGGTGYAFDDDYFIIGVGANYFVADGFSLGLNIETWTSGDPSLTKVTTSAQYTFYQARIKPYVGAFYRRVFIEDFSNLDSYGGKAGLYFAAGGNLYFNAGLVYEEYSQCKESVYRDCSDSYPEFGATLAF